MNPSRLTGWLDNAVLDVVVIDLLSCYPTRKGAGNALPILRVDRLSPETRILIELFYWQAPDPLKAWADIQNPLRLQRREPYHLRDIVGHPAKPFLTLLQSCLGAFTLDRNGRQVRDLFNDLLIFRSGAARFTP